MKDPNLLVDPNGLWKYKVCDERVQSWVYYRLMEMYRKVCLRQYCRNGIVEGYVPVMAEYTRTLSKRMRDYNHWRIRNGET